MICTMRLTLTTILCFAGFLMLIATPASAAHTSSGVPLSQSYTWHDGQRQHTVWLNPDTLAEFNPGPAADSPVKRMATASLAVAGKRAEGIRLWRLDAGITPLAATRALRSSHPQGKYSPVLHDAASSTGRMRALPGNIIVHLDPAWTAEQVSAWARSRQLEIVKTVDVGPNIVVIRSEPGIPGLVLANRLRGSGEVRAAYPDWWQETVAR
jgi:hypothetical protein